MEEKKFVIYKHENLINHKVYIGQTCQRPERRWQNGLSTYRHNQHFINAIKKYGWENFSHQILEENLSYQEVKLKEAYYVDFYDAINPQKGYNLVPGGGYSPFFFLWQNKNFREKMSTEQSARMKERLKNPEVKEKLMKANKKYWENHPEQKEILSKRMSQKLQELWQDPEYRKKKSQQMKNQWKNDSFREKKSRQSSLRMKEQWSDTNFKKKICKKVQNIETGKIFESAAEAARWCGLADRSGITKNLTGKLKSAGKNPKTHEPLHWIYYENGKEVKSACEHQEEK